MFRFKAHKNMCLYVHHEDEKERWNKKGVIKTGKVHPIWKLCCLVLGM